MKILSSNIDLSLDQCQCFSIGVPRHNSVPPICLSLLLLFFKEKGRHLGCNKVVLLGLFHKFLALSVPPNFF